MLNYLARYLQSNCGSILFRIALNSKVSALQQVNVVFWNLKRVLLNKNVVMLHNLFSVSMKKLALKSGKNLIKKPARLEVTCKDHNDNKL